MNDWHKEETYKSLIQISTSALRFVLLANGGAAIAILAFIGKIYSAGTAGPDVAPTLGWFLGGVVVGGVAHFTAYMTQLALYNERKEYKWYQNHRFWLHTSLVLIVLGIACFGAGAWCGVNAIVP